MKTREDKNEPTVEEQDTSKYFEDIKNDRAALRQFFTAMPKGGDLHNHLTGSAYAETYFEMAAKKEMYVDMTTGKLYKDKPEGIKVVRLSKDMDDLHNHRMELIDKWSIRNFQPYKYPLGPDEYFFGTFGLLSALTSDIDDLAHLMRELKKRAVKENVQYLEVMASSPHVPEYCFLDEADYKKYDTDLKSYVKKGDDDKAKALLGEIYDLIDTKATEAAADYLEFIKQLDEKSRIDEETWETTTDNGKRKLLCRYQGYSSRGGEPLKVFAQLYVVHKACLLSSDEKENLLVGCNIVAAENGEKSMLYYHLHMQMFAVLADKQNENKGEVKVNTSLHAGELTLGLTRPEHLTYHIDQAVNMTKVRRIGHGVDLPFEPNSKEILKTMKDHAISVEINLTSNEFILGVKDSEHPIMLYHKAGVPIVISTDDPGILRTSLTEQYTLATLRYGFSYFEIRDFADNSILCSFLNSKEFNKLRVEYCKLSKDFEATIRENHPQPTLI
nr:hypothetical protein [Parabacteroides goldsteinii]